MNTLKSQNKKMKNKKNDIWTAIKGDEKIEANYAKELAKKLNINFNLFDTEYKFNSICDGWKIKVNRFNKDVALFVFLKNFESDKAWEVVEKTGENTMIMHGRYIKISIKNPLARMKVIGYTDYDPENQYVYVRY